MSFSISKSKCFDTALGMLQLIAGCPLASKRSLQTATRGHRGATLLQFCIWDLGRGFRGALVLARQAFSIPETIKGAKETVIGDQTANGVD